MKTYHVTIDGKRVQRIEHNHITFQSELGLAWICLYVDGEPLPFQFSMVREAEGLNRQTTSIVLLNGEILINSTAGMISMAMAINVACNMIRRALPLEWHDQPMFTVYDN